MFRVTFLKVILRGWYPPWNTSAPPGVHWFYVLFRIETYKLLHRTWLLRVERKKFARRAMHELDDSHFPFKISDPPPPHITALFFFDSPISDPAKKIDFPRFATLPTNFMKTALRGLRLKGEESWIAVNAPVWRLSERPRFVKEIASPAFSHRYRV